VGVVAQLRGSDDAAPITALVRGGGDALEFVREALDVLGELDPHLLVRVALDALVCAHVDDRGATRRSAASASSVRSWAWKSWERGNLCFGMRSTVILPWRVLVSITVTPPVPTARWSMFA
jgi:hypothetical protein